MKFLLLLAVLTGVYFIFFKKRDKNIENGSAPTKPHSDRNPSVGEELVPCYKCGILATESDTIIHNGQQFCSKECAGI